MRQKIHTVTERGVVLTGVLFREEPRAEADDTVLICITGVHGNFYSNPFYYNFGDTLAENGYSFVYAQTNDAFNRMDSYNMRTREPIVIGSYDERFRDADEDVASYLVWAKESGYKHVVLGGHSLGANKVIHYLAHNPPEPDRDNIPEKFLLLSPANVGHMTSVVNVHQREIIRRLYDGHRGEERLPFDLFGWLPCIADTGRDWVFSGILDNVHTKRDADYGQLEHVLYTGAMLIGTFDTFTDGDPPRFLQNINDHMPSAAENELIFVEGTGHTYQRKEQQTADVILALMQKWYPRTARS